LEEAGYRILEACDAKEAMAHLGERNEGNINLVITDLNLPGQSGGELVKAVKAQHPDVRVIMISAAVESSQTTLAKRIGINAILPKPVEPETLLETVRGRSRLRTGGSLHPFDYLLE
jgi:DNA-binding response OmpR family regulator